MRKTILMVGVAICIICAAFIFGVFFAQRDAIHSQDLTLSDYPKVFAKEAVIVIGENASLIEIESAEAITANLENLTGNKPEIVSSKKIDSFKYTHNLILLGTPNSNVVLEEVYNMANATRVTEGYPGENKGILEILRNPWNEEKAMLLVEGSNEWWVKAGSKKLVEEGEKLQGKTIVTEKIETTLIELTGCVGPAPKYVTLPVTLPIDTKEEAMIIVEACSKNSYPEVGKEPMNITVEKDKWFIFETPSPQLGYSTWSITINKTSGKTECALLI